MKFGDNANKREAGVGATGKVDKSAVDWTYQVESDGTRVCRAATQTKVSAYELSGTASRQRRDAAETWNGRAKRNFLDNKIKT